MSEPTSNRKVVLITGANGGLGRAVTNAFIKASAAVVGVSRMIADFYESPTDVHTNP